MVKTTAIKVEERGEQPYMGIRTEVHHMRLNEVIPQLLGEIFGWLRTQGIAPTGAPLLRYYVINMEMEMDIELGVPVASAVPGEGRIQPQALPAGRYASLIYTGVENGIEGNKVLVEWAKENGIEWDRHDVPTGDAFAARYETFITDPDDEPDSAKWDTEVAIKLADK